MEEIVEVLKMRGHIRMVLGDRDGNPLEERNFFNLCVTQGRSWVLGQLNTVNQVTSQTLTYIAIGSSTVAPTTADTALNAEIIRNAIGTFTTSTLTINPPSLQMLVSFATNQGNTTLAECGVFNSNAGGTMLAHATFTSFVKLPLIHSISLTQSVTETLMAENSETFTVQDRRELIRQGMQLDKLEQDVIDLKVLVNSSFKDSRFDQRIRELEDAQLILKTQKLDYEIRMSSRLNSYLIIATLIAGAVGTGIQFLFIKLLR